MKSAKVTFQDSDKLRSETHSATNNASQYSVTMFGLHHI